MIYSPVIHQSQQKTYRNIPRKTDQRKTDQRKTDQARFLVIGYSSDTTSDHAVGIQIANRISAWKLPSVTSIATYQLTPALVNHLALVDYAFFISSCQTLCRAETLQLDPISVSTQPPQNKQSAAKTTPFTLLNLSQQLYGRAPQAWLLQIPTDSTSYSKELSAMAQRGCDRALRTIERFLITYR